MSKLFALEDLENEPVAGELEATPEVGEVADVQVDVDADVDAGGEASDAIEEGMGAADQLEEVQDVVESAAEGEGLDPIAAEAIRIAVEAICARVGANPKAMYSLYATENFQSASSRKANTKIALEGVGEFLKDMWKKIKAALQRLWEKTKAFWDKHVSSLGRIKKALESAKARVGESSGKLKDKAFIEEAPSALVESVGFDGDISTKSISSIIAAHATLMASADQVVQKTADFNSAAGANITDIGSAIGKITGSAPAKTGHLVGGVTIEYKFDTDKEEGTVNLEVERENVDRKDKGGVSLAEKGAVKAVLEEMLKVINDNIKAKDKQAKLQESFNKFSMSIEKAINGEADATKQKDLRKGMKVAYKINAKAPVIQNEVLALNIKLAKAVLGFAGLCIKSYK